MCSGLGCFHWLTLHESLVQHNIGKHWVGCGWGRGCDQGTVRPVFQGQMGHWSFLNWSSESNSHSWTPNISQSGFWPFNTQLYFIVKWPKFVINLCAHNHSAKNEPFKREKNEDNATNLGIQTTCSQLTKQKQDDGWSFICFAYFKYFINENCYVLPNTHLMNGLMRTLNFFFFPWTCGYLF